MTGTTRIWVLLAVLALLGAGVFLLFQTGPLQVGLPEQIGRASCRERV